MQNALASTTYIPTCIRNTEISFSIKPYPVHRSSTPVLAFCVFCSSKAVSDLFVNVTHSDNSKKNENKIFSTFCTNTKLLHVVFVHTYASKHYVAL